MREVVCLIYEPVKSGLASESPRVIYRNTFYIGAIVFSKLFSDFIPTRNKNLRHF